MFAVTTISFSYTETKLRQSWCFPLEGQSAVKYIQSVKETGEGLRQMRGRLWPPPSHTVTLHIILMCRWFRDCTCQNLFTAFTKHQAQCKFDLSPYTWPNLNEDAKEQNTFLAPWQQRHVFCVRCSPTDDTVYDSSHNLCCCCCFLHSSLWQQRSLSGHRCFAKKLGTRKLVCARFVFANESWHKHTLKLGQFVMQMCGHCWFAMWDYFCAHKW